MEQVRYIDPQEIEKLKWKLPNAKTYENPTYRIPKTSDKLMNFESIGSDVVSFPISMSYYEFKKSRSFHGKIGWEFVGHVHTDHLLSQDDLKRNDYFTGENNRLKAENEGLRNVVEKLIDQLVVYWCD